MKNTQPTSEEYAKSMLDKLDNDPVLKTYIPLNYKASEVGKEMAEEATRSWLLNKSSIILAVFGDYGSGKTVLCKKICFDLFSDFVSGKNKKFLPIFIEVKDFSSKGSLLEDKDFSNVLKKYCPVFIADEKNYSYVIVLDGIDDLPIQNKNESLLFLAKILESNQRVILTCRTNFFETEQDCLTFLSGAIHLGLYIEHYQAAKPPFDLKYLEQFSQSDMQSFIKSVLGDPAWDPFSKIFWTYDLEDLSQTPIMLDLLLKILPKIDNKRIRSRDSIYQGLIHSWFKREARRGINQNILIKIMKSIAEEMILSTATEISSVALCEKVRREFLQRNLPQISLEGLNSMVTLSGFLSRDFSGNYSFTHRSIMEYFFAMVLEEKIKENHLTFFRDEDHLLYPDYGDLAFGLGPGFSKKNAAGPILEKINLTGGNSFSEVYPLSRGFIELFGSMLARDKIEGEVAEETYRVFREKQGLRDDEAVLYSDAELMKGNKDQEAIEPKKSKLAYKRVRMIGGEGRIYYNFNVYNFSLLINGQNIEDKWGILVSKTRSWVHT
jgi:hypothetical protein